jgi:NAD(P)-dependent dehydrogenase (short-subunit alcohol dehydrogenase family)
LGSQLSQGIALLTGGSGLVGSAIGAELSRRGIEVHSIDIQLPKAQIPEIFYHQADITNRLEIESLISKISKLDSIDYLVHCAAIDPKVGNDIKNVAGFQDELFDSISKEFDVSILGALFTIQSFLRHIERDFRKSRSIVLLGSDLSVISPDQRVYLDTNGVQTFYKPISYSIIKHGIVGMTKYLATLLADKNIRVNCVSPGPILDQQPDQLVTELENRIPMGRLASVNEVAGVVSFLLSDDSTYINGQNLVVDGGRTIW